MAMKAMKATKAAAPPKATKGGSRKAMKAAKAVAPPKAMKPAKEQTLWWSIDTRNIKGVELKINYKGTIGRILEYKLLADGTKVIMRQ